MIVSIVSLQLGMAIATTAFDDAGPLGAVWIRSLVGGGLLALYLRPKLRDFTREQWKAIAPFALALVVLNGFSFLALDRAPLGIVSAIEMLGPLTVAVLGRRGGGDFAWIALAAVGVAALAFSKGLEGESSLLGIVFAGIAATGWGLYIVFGKKVNEVADDLSGLAAALILGAIVFTPFGLAYGGSGLFTLEVLGILALAGVLSTLIPFSLEMISLRTMAIGLFGLLMALEPAVAAMMGYAIRDQALSGVQLAGIGLVVLATAGIMGPSSLRKKGGLPEGVAEDSFAGTLGRVPLFDDLSAAELDAVAQKMRPLEVPSGTRLIEQGAPGGEFYVVTEGTIDIFVSERHVNTMRSGDFMGELALLFGGPRTASAVASESASVLVMGRADFAELLEAHSSIRGKVMAVTAQRLRVR